MLMSILAQESAAPKQIAVASTLFMGRPILLTHTLLAARIQRTAERRRRPDKHFSLLKSGAARNIDHIGQEVEIKVVDTDVCAALLSNGD